MAPVFLPGEGDIHPRGTKIEKDIKERIFVFSIEGRVDGYRNHLEVGFALILRREKKKGFSLPLLTLFFNCVPAIREVTCGVKEAQSGVAVFIHDFRKEIFIGFNSSQYPEVLV